ncbi:MAG: nucleotidyltransferase family protein [Candidatus Liptonbacteria bacterium]|nr:nucleotidyltransferase family protein [Candidatus Liptonbacteria bacterium]
MKAVILAGGAGTRLRPITYEIPKPLLPVKKKPIISHLIELFLKHGVSEIAVLASRSHDKDFLSWRKNLEGELAEANINIFFEDEQRGTFGGLELLKNWLNGEPFILSNGDELKDFDLSAMKNFHEEKGGIGTIALVSVQNPSEYGVPVMSGHHINEFLEKPNPSPSNYISSGLYILEPKIFDYADFSNRFIMIEKDIFPEVASNGELVGFMVEKGRWYDCGNLERWEKAIKEW